MNSQVRLRLAPSPRAPGGSHCTPTVHEAHCPKPARPRGIPDGASPGPGQMSCGDQLGGATGMTPRRRSTVEATPSTASVSTSSCSMDSTPS